MQKKTQSQELNLEATSSPGVVHVNAKCFIHTEGETCDVFAHGVPVLRFEVNDIAGFRLMLATAVKLDWARPGELAAALGCSTKEIQRARVAFERGGIEALCPKRRGPKGPRISAETERKIMMLRKQGVSFRAIVQRVGLSLDCVHRTYVRLSAPVPKTAAGVVAPEQVLLFELPAAVAASGALDSSQAIAAEHVPLVDAVQVPEQACHPGPASLDVDADDRSLDRLAARRGALQDAVPLFKDRAVVPKAGALLVVPLLVASGLLQAGHKTYSDDMGPAFYGLRNSLMWLVFMSVLRIKNAESVKQFSPQALGWLLGLDRAPEVKTIRRKLASLGDDSVKTEAFLSELVKARVASHSEALGYLYCDGHLRAYSGKANIPKTHLARMRICQPAAQELWINDADGQPLFFITQEAHPQLVGALPPALAQVRALVGPLRRPTVIFDRGGWSPQLFAQMNRDRFDVVTYRKGAAAPLQASAFVRHEVTTSRGQEVFDLADTEVDVGHGLTMRQVTRLQPGGHQTHICTTRRDLPALELAQRMFWRWRQENFFKYMRQEFAIDALVQYATEPAEPTRTVANPERAAIDRQIAVLRKELLKLQAAHGAESVPAPAGQQWVQPRGQPELWAASDLPELINQGRARIAVLQTQRKQMPARKPVATAVPTAERLVPWRKRLSDGLKTLTYQIESDLYRLVSPHYRRADDEGRKVVLAALHSAASLRVTATKLVVTLQPQSSPHRTRAVAELCRYMTETHTTFPGTNLVLSYEIQSAKVDISEIG